MKIRSFIMIAMLIVSCGAVFADSPAKGTIVYSPVPVECLRAGFALGHDGWTFTCVLLEKGDVFDQITGNRYRKTIFAAKAEKITTVSKDFGFVVEQNEVSSAGQLNKVAIANTPKGTVAYSKVPYECLTKGTAIGAGDYEGWKFTCTFVNKIEGSDKITGNRYHKTIFAAKAEESTTASKDYGFVVEQREENMDRVAVVNKGAPKGARPQWQYTKK